MKISINIRNVYGVEQAYPACDDAETFAKIAGTKTLQPATLRLIAELGYEIEVVANTGRLVGVAA
jgi:hypothetical protein